MNRNRIISLLLAALSAVSLSACGTKPQDSTSAAQPESSAVTEDTQTTSADSAAVSGESDSTGTSAASVTETTASTEPESRFVFQPKLSSAFMEEIFGKTMCETWYNLVDAVMAGEDTFACPDQQTYGWVMGQFPRIYFPVLYGQIDLAYDRNNSVKDGIAEFTYLVPKEELKAKIEDFSARVELLLNQVFSKDDTDMEKALALYQYFSEHYEYDDETYEKMYQTFVDYTTPYRLFTTGTGICSEIAPMYSYLLMQAGVEATTMMGPAHEWSYVRINGKNYHIDPTFVISNRGSLAYFMMTDTQRELDGYPRSKFVITSNYSTEKPHPDYQANDETFAPLWDRQFESIDREKRKIHCWQYTEGWEKDYLDFDYTGF